MRIAIEDKIYSLKKVSHLWRGDFEDKNIRDVVIFWNRNLGEYQLKIHSRKNRCIFTFTSGSENILGKYIYNSCSSIEKEHLRPALVAVLK